MKELSIEEKAKRYDESLKRVKEQLDGAKVFDYKEEQIAHDIRTTAYAIFPELREESEDERIRKALIKYLDALDDDEIRYGVSFKDMRTWLEKQTKASKVEQAMREVEEKAKAFTESHKGETSEEILAQMRGEQKPWNEEDDYNLQCCIAKIQYDIDNGRIGRNRELLTWLKSLRPQNKWKPSDEQMDALRYVANFDYGGHKATLVSLYEQLKKLKGE